ncbi:guanine nucleotide-binding protein subunit gamma [Monosporozyma unispora]|nr:hypothetical protein C6P44_003668 [Kazachstania unispora]
MSSTQQQQLQLKIKYLKLKRINELNNNLRNELGRERITASNACLNSINYIQTTKDYTLPEIWGHPQPNSNHFIINSNMSSLQQRHQNNDTSNGCCTIM